MTGRPALLALTPRQQLQAGKLPERLIRLFVGLFAFGISMAMMLRAGLGVMPWDVFHQGVTHHVPLGFGAVVIILSFIVLLAWIPLRQWPSLGTVANAIFVGIFVDIGLGWIPVIHPMWARVAVMAAGIVLNGIATALYVGAQLGPGPRDGLMTGLHRTTGVSIRLIRTSIEVVVLGSGWLLGGNLGVGTLAFALAIGPIVQGTLPLLTVRIDHPLHRRVDTGANAGDPPAATAGAAAEDGAQARSGADADTLPS